MAWRNCRASLTLLAAINAKWPDRDRASDGTIGDAAHATRTSDHNPWVVVDGMGVVRARDIDRDGIDAAWLAEELRKAGAAGDPRLTGGGYVIYNRRITDPTFSSWRYYGGSNPHTSHAHVSFSRNRSGFDSDAPWAFLGQQPYVPPPAPAAFDPGTLRTLTYGMRNDRGVAQLQAFLNRYNWQPPLPLLPVTGNYLAQTREVIRRAQAQCGITGPDADGRVVGPRTKAEFGNRGARW